MRIFLIIIALTIPVLTGNAQNTTKSPAQKSHKKEIAPGKLPDNVSSYITANLPHAVITKAVKQKRNPGATWVVSVKIKDKHHTLVFNKAGELVKLDGKKLENTVPKGK